MAIIIEGKTRCMLCGHVLARGETIVAYPAFLHPSHPLGAYSDAAMHRRCFDRAPERDEVEKAYVVFRREWDRKRALGRLAIAWEYVTAAIATAYLCDGGEGVDW